MRCISKPEFGMFIWTVENTNYNADDDLIHQTHIPLLNNLKIENSSDLPVNWVKLSISNQEANSDIPLIPLIPLIESYETKEMTTLDLQWQIQAGDTINLDWLKCPRLLSKTIEESDLFHEDHLLYLVAAWRKGTFGGIVLILTNLSDTEEFTLQVQKDSGAKCQLSFSPEVQANEAGWLEFDDSTGLQINEGFRIDFLECDLLPIYGTISQ